MHGTLENLHDLNDQADLVPLVFQSGGTTSTPGASPSARPWPLPMPRSAEQAQLLPQLAAPPSSNTKDLRRASQVVPPTFAHRRVGRTTPIVPRAAPQGSQVVQTSQCDREVEKQRLPPDKVGGNNVQHRSFDL